MERSPGEALEKSFCGSSTNTAARSSSDIFYSNYRRHTANSSSLSISTDKKLIMYLVPGTNAGKMPLHSITSSG
jgi:hypothetical protein